MLIDLILGPNLTPGSRLEIDPTDRPEASDYQVDPELAAARAFANRPELATARKEVERLEIQRKFRRNQMLPQLDVVTSYGYRGISGKGQPIPNLEPDPGEPSSFTVDIPSRYHNAHDDLLQKDNRTWSVRGVFSIPIGNNSARAEARKAALELRRAQTRYRRVEQNIVLEVREAIRNLRSTREGIEAAEERRRATREQLRAEQIRLEHGESTPFNVLEREEDLVEAERERIFALREYRNSIVGLDRAQGTILEDRRVLLQDARALRRFVR